MRPLVLGLAIAATAGLSAGMVPVASSGHSAGVTLPGLGMSTFDPSQWGGQDLLDQGTVLEGLTGYNAQNQIIPVVAKRWTVADGGQVWTFYLHHHLKWSNGQPVTAEDFYYSWLRTASPANTTSAMWASIAGYLLNAGEYHNGALPAKDVGVKVINPYELRLTLAFPHNILGDLAIAGSMPLYPPVIHAHPKSWYLPQYFVGNGPLVPTSFVINGQITLARNRYYRAVPGQPPAGNLQTVTLIPTPSVPVEDFLANRIAAAIITAPSDYRYVLQRPALKADLHKAALTSVTFLEWNKSTMRSPLDNATVRQAISMAINRTPLVKSVLNGMGRPSAIFGFPGWPTDHGQHPLPYNVTKARQLLAKAGYPNGKGFPTLYLDTPTMASNPLAVGVAEAIKQEMKQNLGITFQIDQLAPTVDNFVNWQGLTPNIKPGYTIVTGGANWVGASTLLLKSNQDLFQPGELGPAWYRDHIANYYFQAYDHHDVQMWGDPNNSKLGVHFSDWAPLVKSAEADIKWLNAWMARQPKAFRITLVSPGAPTNQQLWNGYVAAWKKAKTAAQKHQAWVNAWKFVGNYNAGNGLAGVGLQGQVYMWKNMPANILQAERWNSEEFATASSKQEIVLADKMNNFMMDQAYAIPLYSAEAFYLEKPDLHHVQVNPYAFGGFWQFGALSTK